MPRFQFTRDPAWITIGDGISLAFAYWRATALWWAIPVLLMGLLSGILTAWTLEAARSISPETYIRGYELDWGAFFGALAPQFVLTVGVTAAVDLVVRWAYLGLVVTGLRGGGLHAGWVVRRGVRVLGADLLASLVFGVLAGAVVVAALASPGLGLLVWLVAIVVWIGFAIRVAFWQISIFDGDGIAAALTRTLTLTRGAGQRVIGWWLAAFGLAIALAIPLAILGGLLGGLPAITAGLRSAFQEGFAVFNLFLVGVLYESQRRRVMPGADEPALDAPAPPPAPTWGPGYAAAPGTPVDSLGRPIATPPPDPGPPAGDAPAPPPRDPWKA